MPRPERPTRLERDMIRAVLSIQFGPEAAVIADREDLMVVRSSTGRVRYVYVGSKLIGTIRATDGRFVPTVAGGALLHELLPPGRLRVVAPKEAAEHVAHGRSLFCKHVVGADPEIVRGEEVLVVDEEGRLLAVGKAALSGREMVEKNAGVAVKVRKGREG